MARNSRQKEPEPEPEDVGLDEVDEFAKEQEKITLEKAGWDGKDESSEEESDGEQAVMDINDSGDDDEENSAAKAEIEAYRKKLQGPIDEDEEAYFVDKGEAERYLEEGSGSGKAGQKDGEEDEDEAWGDSKGEYYGAEDLDEEDEEDAKATEKEALKIDLFSHFPCFPMHLFCPFPHSLYSFRPSLYLLLSPLPLAPPPPSHCSHYLRLELHPEKAPVVANPRPSEELYRPPPDTQ